MRKILTITAVLLLGLSMLAGDLKVIISPQPVIVGESAQLRLINSDGSYPRLRRLPKVDGIKWLGGPSQSMRTSIVNMKRSVSAESVYTFQATKQGKIEIPPMKVEIDNKKTLSDPISFKAVKRNFQVKSGNGSKSVSLDDLLFIRIQPLSNKKEFFIGEEIPLEIRVYAVSGLKFQLSYPQLDLENIVYHDYAAVNRDNPQYDKPREGEQVIDGQTFSVYVFRTAFRCLGAGEKSSKVSVDCKIRIPRKRGQRRSRSLFDDDFFGDPFGSRHQWANHQLTTNLPNFQVENLPKVPDNSQYLGLVGDWRVKTGLSTPEEYMTGEPITLKMTILGKGTLETLKAPKLKIPGFRIYPPETEKSSSHQEKAEIKYVVIPLEAGPSKIELTPVVFSCAEGKYKEFPFSKTITVKKSDKMGSLDQVYLDSKSEHSTAAPAKKRRERQASGIIYLKKKPFGAVAVPLWRNQTPWYIFFIIFGPLVWIICELLRFHRNRLANDPELVRKRSAQSRRGKVLRAIGKAADDQVDEIAQKEVLPYLNDLLGEVPGTTATELAAKVKDSELAECLKEVGNSNYMPGSVTMNKSELKTKLQKALKRMALFFLLIACSAQGFGQVVAKIVKDSPEALQAYDNGDFKAAAAYYQSKINPDEPDPNLLYNLGNCLYQMGDFAKALVCYERAARLKPGDSDIHENLNYVRRKLGSSEIGKTERPIDIVINLRDSLRPDQWFLGVCIIWTMFFLFFACRRTSFGKHWGAALVICLLFCTVFVIAGATQLKSTYSAGKAIVIKNNAPVLSLPSEKTGRVIFKFKSGEEVKVEEQRSGWARVRADQAEGWVRKNEISRLWFNGER